MRPCMPRRIALPGVALALALAALPHAPTASARDLGVQAKTWDVTEIDVRRLVVESAADADWTQAHGELERSAARYLESLPRRSLPVAERTQTRWIDPSMTLASDIRVPVRDASTGRWSWQVLYRKGQTFNPLSTQRPLTAMLYFDARDERQTAFVQDALARNPLGVVPVEVSGANPAKLARRFERPVFHADEALLARFAVDQVPALLYPGEGVHALALGLTTFASPFRIEELERAWPTSTAIRGNASAKGAPNARTR